jgi:2-(3-amino-3-carboxypropyl)histidine synthase
MVTKKFSDQELFQDYNIDSAELITWVKSNKFKTIALQFPEGLMRQATNVINLLEAELGITVMLIGDPCFGACDIISNKLGHLGVEGIVHFGHAEIPNFTSGEIPIKYVELVSKLDPSAMLQKDRKLQILKSELRPGSSIGLATNIQFITYLGEIKSILEQEGFKVQIGTGNSRIKHNGQVLGCNFSAVKDIQDKVDLFLFIGDGMFHPLGISLATKKKVLMFDPIRNTIQNISFLKDKILRQRGGALARAKDKDCKNFGILISTKPGQARKNYALKLQEKLELYGRSGTLIVMDNITPAKLDYLPFDAYINTACPRLTIDDYMQYKKVILTPVELEIILGERAWGQYQFDEIM